MSELRWDEECGEENEITFDNELTNRDEVEVSQESTKRNQNLKWTEFEISLLIVAYKENAHKFKSPRYNNKQVWHIISQALKNNDIFKDGTKCFEKWRNLKKMYEKVLKHNNSTGNNRKSWPYFEALHDIYFCNPQITPIATFSSTGAQTSRTSKGDTDVGTLTKQKSEDLLNIASTSKFSGKKIVKLTNETDLNDRERRHRERMEQKERMFNWFKAYMTKSETYDSD